MIKRLIVATLVVAASSYFAPAITTASPERVLPVAEVSHIHGVAFDPLDPAHLLLATHTGLFRAGTDGLAVQVSPDNHDYMGFSVRSDGTMFSSGHPTDGGNLGFRASEDGGVTWVTLSPGADGPVDFHSIAVSPELDGPMVGLYRGGIQQSDEGGGTWRWVDEAPDQTLDLAIPPGASGEILAATMSGLMDRTPSGGWQQIRGGVATMVHVSPDGKILAFFAGEGLLTSKDGKDWSMLWPATGNDPILHLAVSPSDWDTLAAVTYEGRIMISTDGGASWSDFEQ